MRAHELTGSRLTDPNRLAALARSLLLDGPADDGFDRITALLARLLAVPVALVSIVDADRQVFRSCVGLDLPETPLSHSFCQHVVLHGEPLVVSDAREDPALSSNLAVGDLGVIAYAGWPLRLEGQVLGSLCAIDTKPRTWAEEDVALIEELAGLVERLIVLRRDALDERTRHSAQSAESSAVEALSRRLQLALLPRHLDDTRIHTTYEPGSDRLLLGGDFADVRVNADGTLEFIIGDVSGHGPEAAALATAVRASWGTLRRQDVGVEDLLAALEDVVHVERADEDLYATVLVGTLARDGELCVACAGHPPPIVIGATAREVPVTAGVPLGLDIAGGWATTTVDVADEPVLLYTDGLIEGRAAPAAVERFGLGRLLAAIDARGAIDAEVLGSHLITTATGAHGGPLPDDVTTLLIQR